MKKFFLLAKVPVSVIKQVLEIIVRVLTAILDYLK